MPQLQLHVCNRLDLLAKALAQAVAEPLPSPFTPETVIVQSAAAGRWLGLRLAEFTGICANYKFPFLAQIIASLLANDRHGTPAAARPTVELLAWRIDSALRRCSGEPEFAGVARYLADGDPLKRFALARRIAVLFDQYRVYRPDLLLRWSGATTDTLPVDETWQAKLWLAVDGGCAFDHALAELRAHGFRNIDAPALPARLSIFAPNVMAPAYLDLLLQLAKVSEVHLFLLRPTPACSRGGFPTPRRPQVSAASPETTRRRIGIRAMLKRTKRPLPTKLSPPFQRGSRRFSLS